MITDSQGHTKHYFLYSIRNVHGIWLGVFETFRKCSYSKRPSACRFYELSFTDTKRCPLHINRGTGRRRQVQKKYSWASDRLRIKRLHTHKRMYWYEETWRRVLWQKFTISICRVHFYTLWTGTADSSEMLLNLYHTTQPHILKNVIFSVTTVIT